MGHSSTPRRFSTAAACSDGRRHTDSPYGDKHLASALQPMSTFLLSVMVAVTAAAEGSEYSYTVPIGERNPNTGFVAIVGREIVTINSVQNYKFYVERVLGETNAIEMYFETYSATSNVVAGTHYTAASGTIRYENGEVGRKSFTIPVLAMSVGRGIIGVDLTGAAYRDRCYLSLKDGSARVGAFYMNDNGGADSSTATGGSGTSVSPDVNPTTCVARAANGGHVYMKSGNYKHRFRRSGGKMGGMNVPTGSRSKTNPLIIEAEHGATVVMDLNYEGVHDNAIGNWGCSCITINPGASDVFIFGEGITLQRSHGHAFSTEPGQVLNSFSNHIVVDGLTIQDCGQQGPEGAGSDNVGGMFLYECNNSIFQNNVIRRIYARDRGTSNPFDSWAAAVTNGILVFHCQNTSYVGNTFDVVGYGIAFKGGPGINTGVNHAYTISHNLFERARDCIAMEGYNYYSSSYGMDNAIIRYNTSDNPNYAAGVVNGWESRTDNFFESWTNASGRIQCTGLEVTNNVVRNVRTPLDIQNQDEVISHSNIFEGTTNEQYGVLAVSGRTSRMRLSDHNLFYGGAGASNFILGGSSYSSLATWRTAPSGAHLSTANPDTHSTQPGTAPSYANAAANDYRNTTDTVARYGKARGVYDQLVGAA